MEDACLFALPLHGAYLSIAASTASPEPMQTPPIESVPHSQDGTVGVPVPIEDLVPDQDPTPPAARKWLLLTMCGACIARFNVLKLIIFVNALQARSCRAGAAVVSASEKMKPLVTVHNGFVWV